MELSAINPTGAGALMLQAKTADSSASFAGELKNAEARQAAEQFVSSSLLFPLLEQMQNDPFKTDLFHGGFGEDAFMQQWNQIIADRIVQSTDLPIVREVENTLTQVKGARWQGVEGSSQTYRPQPLGPSTPGPLGPSKIYG